MNTKPYKSPKHKLICLFEKSRNMWKERAQGYFRKNRAFQVRVRDLEASPALAPYEKAGQKPRDSVFLGRCNQHRPSNEYWQSPKTGAW